MCFFHFAPGNDHHDLDDAQIFCLSNSELFQSCFLSDLFTVWMLNAGGNAMPWISCKSYFLLRRERKSSFLGNFFPARRVWYKEKVLTFKRLKYCRVKSFHIFKFRLVAQIICYTRRPVYRAFFLLLDVK